MVCWMDHDASCSVRRPARAGSASFLRLRKLEHGASAYAQGHFQNSHVMVMGTSNFLMYMSAPTFAEGDLCICSFWDPEHRSSIDPLSGLFFPQKIAWSSRSLHGVDEVGRIRSSARRWHLRPRASLEFLQKSGT